ncbi:uncharacterized protein ARMOST_15242 [Armillaria ostoyae]|uniref:Uncharacterized protein n=1 Tax=Armillaria ostoyae TaxID=47428 RepID=A0A284RST9_ARMOS|nr:uncharacterized protein ARMOST_15242 [Armillaria ostoyae]
MSVIPVHRPEDARSILRSVFSAQSTALVDSEPAVPLDSIVDVLPILTSHGLHFSPAIFLKLVTFGHAHMGEGHLISSSQFYSLAVSPLIPPASTVPELPTAPHSDPSSPIPPNVAALTPSMVHSGDSDDDTTAGTNATLVRRWKEIRKEKEFAILQYEELKEDLSLSKLRAQKLAAAEAKALHRLNALEQDLSEKQNLLESTRHKCRSIKVKMNDAIREAEQYCAEIERQDAVISQLKESAGHHRSWDYTKSFEANELLIDGLQEEVTRFQEAKGTLHTARSEGMKLFELFEELELQLSQTRHEISSGTTLGYHVPTALHLSSTLADELAGESEVHTAEVAISVGPVKSSASTQTCPLNNSFIDTFQSSGALEQHSTYNTLRLSALVDPTPVSKHLETSTVLPFSSAQATSFFQASIKVDNKPTGIVSRINYGNRWVTSIWLRSWLRVSIGINYAKAPSCSS